MFFFAPFRLFFFCYLFVQWLTFDWAWFQFGLFWECLIETGKFYHGVATCSSRQFCFKFFIQICEHFPGYFRLHGANQSDLGIIGRIFSSCRTWVQMMPSSMVHWMHWIVCMLCDCHDCDLALRYSVENCFIESGLLRRVFTVNCTVVYRAIFTVNAWLTVRPT